MSKKSPSPPTLLSSSTYFKPFVLLVLVFSAALVSAAVFAYYPFSLSTSWVDPPVRFGDPATPGVSVQLHDDETAADVDVASPGVLTRTGRSAFVWDDYSEDPFANGRLTANGGTWSWNPVGYIEVSATSLSSSWGGACVAYYSANPPPGTSLIYVLTKELHATRANDQYSGLIMAESDSEFYLMGYSHAPRRGIRIRKYSGDSWATLASASLNLAENTWFNFLGVRETAGGLSFTVYDNAGAQQGDSISTTDPTVTVNLVGVGIYTNNRQLTACFDDFVACADANPSLVNVTGLKEGWTVYLYDGSGALVKQATAGPDGKVSLEVLTKPIIRNGRLEIKQGNVVILPSQSFSEVVGGDVYECSVKDINILSFRNEDSKAYSVYLRVKSIQVPAGYSGSINLWVGPAETTPIQIVGSSVLVDTTSEITLNPVETSRVHGIFSPSLTPSSQIVLTLSFHYYIPSSKVEVEYPVKVTVHR